MFDLQPPRHISTLPLAAVRDVHRNVGLLNPGCAIWYIVW